MLNRAPRRTPIQRNRFKRRAERVRLRIKQRWGHAFKLACIERGRWRRAQSALAYLLNLIRRV